MMNREQYLLTKLAEECNEVAQIALKTQQFGRDERYPESEFNNRERINLEFNDLLTVVKLLNEEFDYNLQPVRNLSEKKIKKMDHYFNYSIECGMVTNE